MEGRADGIRAVDMPVGVTWTPNNNPGSTVTVQATHDYQNLLVGFLGFGRVDLVGGSTMIAN